MKNLNVRAMAVLVRRAMEYGGDDMTIAEGLIEQGVRFPVGDEPEAILELP